MTLHPFEPRALEAFKLPEEEFEEVFASCFTPQLTDQTDPELSFLKDL